MPPSIGTVITQITSGLSTTTSASEAPVFQDLSQHPIDPTHVKLFKLLKAARVYLAEGDHTKIPPDVMEQWNTKDLGRLMTDLTEVTMKIYRKSTDRAARSLVTSEDHTVSFELRMSGRAARDARLITLRPTVWILCGSRWACKDVRDAMKDITWLRLPLEIHEGSPELATVEERIDVKTLDLNNGIRLAKEVTLYTNVEIPSHGTITANGLLCCSTIRIGDAYLHHISRIGGVISINGAAAQYGVTTAHGMLNNHFVVQPSKSTWLDSSPSKFGAVHNTFSEYEVEDEDEGEESDGGIDMEDHDTISPGLVGFRDPLLVSEWRGVSTGISLNFLGASFEWNSRGALYCQLYPPLSEVASQDIDHALLPFMTATDFEIPNTYLTSPTRVQAITAYKTDAELIRGPVMIALGAKSCVEGELLPGSTCLTVHGQMFSLRKAIFASRLGECV